MHFRFLAFFPFAAVITVFILFSASSFVSTAERSILAEPLPAPIQVSMYESECDTLFRESCGPAAHPMTGSKRRGRAVQLRLLAEVNGLRERPNETSEKRSLRLT